MRAPALLSGLLFAAVGALTLGLLTAPADAATWRVEPDGSGDAATIQAAINVAAAGDTVEVACGTYFESGIVLRDGIRVASESLDPACVTIDAQQQDRVFFCSGVDSAAAIVGLTITGGLADTGGGILCKSASYPRIESCIVEGNVATEGAGIFCFHSSPLISNSTLRNNDALTWGGGLSCYDNASPTLTNCTIEGNTSGDFGGGVWGFFFANPTLVDCSIVGNTAGLDGGGYHGISSDATLIGCEIAGNLAGRRGGGLKFADCNATMTSCTVTGNGATSGQGGGVYLEDTTLDVDRSILWANCASAGREAYVRSDASLTFACSDVDTSGSWLSGTGNATWDGNNFWLDPMFCAPAACGTAPTAMGEYGLQAGSPLLDTGITCGGPIGAAGAAAGCAATVVVEPTPGSLRVNAYPNPFRAATTIEYDIAATGPVQLAVYDASGRLVKTLTDGEVRRAGRHVVRWDGRTDDGSAGAAGVYFYRVSAGNGRGMHRLVRLR